MINKINATTNATKDISINPNIIYNKKNLYRLALNIVAITPDVYTLEAFFLTASEVRPRTLPTEEYDQPLSSFVSI
jgi:hypothetical protein